MVNNPDMITEVNIKDIIDLDVCERAMNQMKNHAKMHLKSLGYNEGENVGIVEFINISGFDLLVKFGGKSICYMKAEINTNDIEKIELLVKIIDL